MGQSQRKHFLVYRKMQLKYILLTVIFLLVYTFLFVCLLLAPYIYALTAGIPLEEQAQAARMLLKLHNSIWPILGVVILVMSCATIFITHRIAGPVYRLKKALNEVAGGNLAPTITLRKKDELKDLAEDISLLISDLRNAVETLYEEEVTLTECIRTVEEMITAKQIEEQAGRDLVLRMTSRREIMSRVVGKYRLSGTAPH